MDENNSSGKGEMMDSYNRLTFGFHSGVISLIDERKRISELPVTCDQNFASRVLSVPNLHKVLRSMSSEPLFLCFLRKVTVFIMQILTDVTDDPLVTANTRGFSK
jgi:hypothetical protein